MACAEKTPTEDDCSKIALYARLLHKVFARLRAGTSDYARPANRECSNAYRRLKTEQGEFREALNSSYIFTVPSFLSIGVVRVSYPGRFTDESTPRKMSGSSSKNTLSRSA